MKWEGITQEKEVQNTASQALGPGSNAPTKYRLVWASEALASPLPKRFCISPIWIHSGAHMNSTTENMGSGSCAYWCMCQGKERSNRDFALGRSWGRKLDLTTTTHQKGSWNTEIAHGCICHAAEHRTMCVSLAPKKSWLLIHTSEKYCT